MTSKPPLVYSCSCYSSAALLLSQFGVRKRRHADFHPEQGAELYIREVLPAARTVAAQRHHAAIGEAAGARSVAAHEA